MDTIFAEATARGRAGVSVIRVSGSHVPKVCRALTGDLPKPRYAKVAAIRSADGQLLDNSLVLYFCGPASFTGEDVLEIQCHGSVAVVSAILKELASFDECRLAEPGEFTRRALLNGKLDLTQVEGLSDLIEAETEVQRVAAQTIMSGQFADFVARLRQDILRAAALLEATIDFADEEIPEDVTEEVAQLLTQAVTQMQVQLDGLRFSEQIRSGFDVAILGRPNVGKSTLFNHLAGREAAITSSHAGTTRDVLEVRMDLNGIPVSLLDTAGLREADDPVEQEGIKRALARAAAADIQVVLVEDDAPLDIPGSGHKIVLRAKADKNADGGGISGKTGEGVAELLGEIETFLQDRIARSSLAHNARHRDAFTDGISGLRKAGSLIQDGDMFFDVASEEIRTVLRRLDGIVGRVDVENLLDVIFSSFCLGK